MIVSSQARLLKVSRATAAKVSASCRRAGLGPVPLSLARGDVLAWHVPIIYRQNLIHDVSRMSSLISRSPLFYGVRL